MSNNVGLEMKEKAKSVNLIEYLFEYHPELICEVGHNRFVHPDHDSLVIMKEASSVIHHPIAEATRYSF